MTEDEIKKEEEKGEEEEEKKVKVAKIEPIRVGDERVHKKRHLLDTCE